MISANRVAPSLSIYLRHTMDSLDVGNAARTMADRTGFIAGVDVCLLDEEFRATNRLCAWGSAPSWHAEQTAAVGVVSRSLL